MDLSRPSIDDICSARASIAGKAIVTPLIKLRTLEEDGLDEGVEIYLKLENLQPLGSFKVRPSANAIARILSDSGMSLHELRTRGVSTASAGNFAQGLSWCCKEMDIKCTVAAPSTAPKVKLDAIRRLGARVELVPYSEWWMMIESHSCPLAPESVFIHPGAETSVLAGNATIAAEIAEDLPDCDCIIGPYGSGAMITGVACGVRALGLEKCRVLACEPETASPFHLSKKHGRACQALNWESSFVDGCGGKSVLPEIWEIARDVVDDGVAVPLVDIANAIKILALRQKVVAEGAGACPVAAAMAGMCGSAKKIVCIVSGGGLDAASLAHILEDRGVPNATTLSKRRRCDAHMLVGAAAIGAIAALLIKRFVSNRA